ncbi:hypothetical protein HUK80_05815 [Flavobacterium sp. MAH-1]|uniref:DUF3325 domain-containing protein n=1 Tax=Flavobacterium agri TaxID=2743471 RepID=A0A7Y9C5I6_9FLAO|nr:hypothetical protein [Flavobacterium agri]NUY80404.1 hypothetical protein [Flavobacterium agri]NYA70429.1 hypothetical protein [Flavobacterium agri]
MMTIGALLAFFGFFSGYNSSRKAVLTGDSKLELWLRNNPSNAKTAGLLLLIAALLLLVMNRGIGAGTFVFFVMLIVFGSLIVLLSPLKIVTLKTAGIAFVIAISIELLNLV